MRGDAEPRAGGSEGAGTNPEAREAGPGWNHGSLCVRTSGCSGPDKVNKQADVSGTIDAAHESDSSDETRGRVNGFTSFRSDNGHVDLSELWCFVPNI